MQYGSFVVDGQDFDRGLCGLEVHADGEEAVWELLKGWHEDGGEAEQTLLVTGPGGHLYACVTRDHADRDIARIYYPATGRVVDYRCVYHLDAEGRFVECEVTLAEPIGV